MTSSPPPVPIEPVAGVLTLPAEAAQRIEHYVTASRAESTRAAYADDLAAWQRWATERGVPTGLPVDPVLVAAWATSMADTGYAPRTVIRRLTGLSAAHKAAGHPAVTEHRGVAQVLRGIRREARGRQPRQARALSLPEVRAIVEDLPEGLLGVRDRALVLTSFALGLRASDAAALLIEDLTATDGGTDVLIRYSKSDPLGEGATIALARGVRPATCPVTALTAWLAALRERGITSGPVFRSVSKQARGGRGGEHIGARPLHRNSVTLVLRAAAARAGLDLDRLSSHSSRRGFATTAYAAGVPEQEIARTGRWRSLDTMRRYNASQRWSDPAAARLGL